MKFELQQMRKQEAGAIVNCSSLEGGIGGAERGIRIKAICTGLIWTPMADQMVASGQGDALKAMEKSIPMGRVGPSRGDRQCSALALQRRRELCDRPIHLGGWRFRHALIPMSFGVRTISMLFGSPGAPSFAVH